MLRLAVLASGGGSNLGAILDAWRENALGECEPVLVVTDRDCPALIRGEEAGLGARLLDRRRLGPGLSAALHAVLEEYRVDLVALAGWLSILDADFIRKWENRVLNIHPSLLPKYGGMGMYGERVHTAVLAAGDTESGCTVHLVDEGVDRGRILGQTRVPVKITDDARALAARILPQEHRLYSRIIAEYSRKIGGRCFEVS